MHFKYTKTSETRCNFIITIQVKILTHTEFVCISPVTSNMSYFQYVSWIKTARKTLTVSRETAA